MSKMPNAELSSTLLIGQALIGNRTEALKPPINHCFISPSLYAVSRTNKDWKKYCKTIDSFYCLFL